VRTCDAFDETAGTGSLAIVLITVDYLVDHNTADLVRATVRAVHYVLASEVDFLGCFRARSIRYTVHGPKDK
jgi:hypothetical protein